MIVGMISRTMVYFLPLLGYLVGAVPFGLLIGRARGVDVRAQGSGNIGATNVGRVLGHKWGMVCFVLDVGKGLLPVLYAGWLLRRGASAPGDLDTNGQLLWLGVGAGCILGHMFSVYLGFRGGKGVATSLGVVLGIWPYFTLAGIFAFFVWTAVWGIWRYVSLASIAAAAAFPVGFGLMIARVQGWVFGDLIPLFGFSCMMAVLVIVRHRGNIRRLLEGTETRGGRSKND